MTLDLQQHKDLYLRQIHRLEKSIAQLEADIEVELEFRRGAYPLVAVMPEELVSMMQERLESEKASLESIRSEYNKRCWELAEKYGISFHDFIQKRFPINAMTKLTKAPSYIDGKQITYVIEEIRSVKRYEEIPPYTDIKEGAAYFEPYSDGHGRIINLAYAPEINTLYWY